MPSADRRILRRTLAAALLALPGLLAALGPGAAQAQAARYELDPDHLSIGFLVDHIGYAKVLGMFRTARGSFSFDEKAQALGDVRIQVDTASVFTNHAKRDGHLKGPDFLNSVQFPHMVFTAGEARRTGERTFELAGQLELRGRTQPLTLQATWNKSAESPLPSLFGKPYVMGVSARGSFRRSAYGMDYAVANGWVGDEVALIIEFEAVRK
jgi:polyisoprenoid-binding protein YceI